MEDKWEEEHIQPTFYTCLDISSIITTMNGWSYHILGICNFKNYYKDSKFKDYINT